MRIAPRTTSAQRPRAGFTLPELLIASTVSIILIGSVILLLIQVVREQRTCLACATVEQKAALLQAAICGCLRSNSSGMGVKFADPSLVSDAAGNPLGYQTIQFFLGNPDGSYSTEQISFTNGAVTYIPDMRSLSSAVQWMTNAPHCVLRQLLFQPECGEGYSMDASLVNIRLEMDDGGYSSSFSARHTTNATDSIATSFSSGPAGIYRSFSVQLRSN